MEAIDLITQEKIKRYFRAKRKLNTPDLVSHCSKVRTVAFPT